MRPIKRVNEGESLTFHQQWARHLGQSKLILSATHVATLIHTARVDDLQCAVTQNHNSVKNQKRVFTGWAQGRVHRVRDTKWLVNSSTLLNWTWFLTLSWESKLPLWLGTTPISSEQHQMTLNKIKWLWTTLNDSEQNQMTLNKTKWLCLEQTMLQSRAAEVKKTQNLK